MELTNNDRKVLKSVRTLVMEWTSAPDHIKDAMNAIIDGMPITEIEPDMRRKLAKMADRLEERAIELDADRIEEAAYILKNVLIYGEEEPYTEIDDSDISDEELERPN